MIDSFFHDRRVLITGHTGFKGAWLTQWLIQTGAKVCGFSLDPPTKPSLYEQLKLNPQIQSIHGDINDLDSLRQLVHDWKPEVVFHLAAQSLVRTSHEQPIDTFQTNVLGTIHLLESLRELSDRCAAVIVTSDKCYQNLESPVGYDESDRLGGADPYSASKAMAELAVESYRRSFLVDSPIRLATVRAGNVIGGGDWAKDRIVPDTMRALQQGKAVPIRNPRSSRPWQHVLDPLGGYLLLATKLFESSDDQVGDYCSAFNFGPSAESHQSVEELVNQIFRTWPGQWHKLDENQSPLETHLLKLRTEKANRLLGWQPRWRFVQAVEETTRWYRQVHQGDSVIDVTGRQIEAFRSELTFS